jgi:sec-independent protein translocase protein TatA
MAMNTLLFLQNFGHWEIILIVVLVLVLFGGKKIPEFMRGIGKGINQFKQGLKEVEDDIKADPVDDNKLDKK